MPRHPIAVKIKSYGAVDIHFHGAFGIDVMTSTSGQLDDLAERLASHGVSAFCPTTLSAPWKELRQAVSRLGAWVLARKKHPNPAHAKPLGIHLEGPYLHSGACGAHPPQTLRRFDLHELETLWQESHQQLKILTLAPEKLSLKELKHLDRWAKKRAVTLSLGHSRATEEQAKTAFRHGFSNVTHGWNALHFHQRAPGTLGAALGRPGVWVELILDQIHVCPTVMRWTRRLHGRPLCYVSDCTPAAATRPGSWHRMGPLKTRLKDGASRSVEGHLAGGGVLLSQAFARWIQSEARHRAISPAALLRSELPSLWSEPLKSIGLSAKNAGLSQVEWIIDSRGRVRCQASDRRESLGSS